MTASDRQGTGATDQLALRIWPSPRTVGEARRAVGQFCRSGNHQALADDAELLTSELMTNACRYSNGPVDVLVLRTMTSVVVTVTDDHIGGAALRPVEQDPEQGSGRGLFLVDAIAGAWGTTEHVGGTSVWFRLP